MSVLSAGPAAVAADCQNADEAIGVSRILTVDTSGGGQFGTFQYPEALGLQDGEVVLTFDDGPHPQYTLDILKALAQQCTKATFFPVGQMARTYPEALKAVSDQGHTIGSHTWRHANVQQVGFARGLKEIERGFAAASLATDGNVAPFFRFPGLRHTKKMIEHLGAQNIATFSVDVISGDTEYTQPQTLIRRTLGLLKRKKKGIVLFHDLKKATARAIPTLLVELKKRGYKIVHLQAKTKLNVDMLIAANQKLNKDDKKAPSVPDTNILLASSTALDAYFGPTWPKRTVVRKRQRANDAPPWWPFN